MSACPASQKLRASMYPLQHEPTPVCTHHHAPPRITKKEFLQLGMNQQKVMVDPSPPLRTPPLAHLIRVDLEAMQVVSGLMSKTMPLHVNQQKIMVDPGSRLWTPPPHTPHPPGQGGSGSHAGSMRSIEQDYAGRCESREGHG